MHVSINCLVTYKLKGLGTFCLYIHVIIKHAAKGCVHLISLKSFLFVHRYVCVCVCVSALDGINNKSRETHA